MNGVKDNRTVSKRQLVQIFKNVNIYLNTKQTNENTTLIWKHRLRFTMILVIQLLVSLPELSNTTIWREAQRGDLLLWQQKDIQRQGTPGREGYGQSEQSVKSKNKTTGLPPLHT